MDQGCNFESQLVADLCKLMGTQKVQTSPYHLQINGQCERFNFTLINMLRMLSKEKKSRVEKTTLEHWSMHTTIPKTQPQGSAPTFSCLGDSLISLFDVTLGLAPQTIMEPNTTKFMQKIRECTQWAHKKAEVFQAK